MGYTSSSAFSVGHHSLEVTSLSNHNFGYQVVRRKEASKITGRGDISRRRSQQYLGRVRRVEIETLEAPKEGDEQIRIRQCKRGIKVVRNCTPWHSTLYIEANGRMECG